MEGLQNGLSCSLMSNEHDEIVYAETLTMTLVKVKVKVTLA